MCTGLTHPGSSKSRTIAESGCIRLQLHALYCVGNARMADAAGNISSDHMSDQQDSDAAMCKPDELVLSDDVIRTTVTMEFTGLPRHQVIDLSLHNDEDPTSTAVMTHLFL